MNEKKPSFFEKYREIIIYIIVGVMTTVYCWVIAWILTLFMDAQIPWVNFLMQTINWVLGVTFAFPLNRKWVFRSTNPHWVAEFLKFSASRISTWAVDVLVMLFFVNVCPLTGLAKLIVRVLEGIGLEMTVDDANYWFVKIFISAVLVMIINYIFSKLIVFKNQKDQEAPAAETTDSDK